MTKTKKLKRKKLIVLVFSMLALWMIWPGLTVAASSKFIILEKQKSAELISEKKELSKQKLVINSGICGESLTWKLYDDGVLEISGSGDMTNFSTAKDVPWSKQCLKISKLILEDSVTSIGDYAFFDCKRLTEVNIPASVEEIGKGVFAGCEKLLEITVDKENAAYTAKKGVLFNKSLTELVCYPSGKKDEIYHIPSGVTRIGYEAFCKCAQLTTIRLPDSLTAIESYAFAYCHRLVSVNLPGNVSDIGFGAFYDCRKLASITIPEGITSIEYGMFYNCKSLDVINLPEGITEIGQEAFEDCTALRKIQLPASLMVVEEGAFNHCKKLKEIYYAGSRANWEKIEIGSRNEPLLESTVYYEKDSLEEEKVLVYHGGSSSPLKFDFLLEDKLTKAAKDLNSPEFDQLTHMLIALCNSVHNESDMNKTMDSLGIEKRNRTEGVYLTYNMGTKLLHTGDTLVLVVIRGTDSKWEWASNLDAKANSKHQHSGFSDAADELYHSMIKFLGTDDFSGIKFVITGHSRGAATANIMAARLVDEGVSQNQIFAYTFACPDVAVITKNTADKYKCIFNIGNVNDFVTWMPSWIWPESGEKDNHGKDSYWDKYGQSYWYCNDWDDNENILTPPSMIELTWDVIHGLSLINGRINGYHLQNLYLDYLGSDKEKQYKNREDTLKAMVGATISSNKSSKRTSRKTVSAHDYTREETITNPVSTGEWIYDGTGWWIRNNDGSYPAGIWKNINYKWYFFDQTGYMKTGWTEDNGCWYYLGSDGAMIENQWILEQGHWYYLGEGGIMKTGWIFDNNSWYYLNENGDMAIDCITPDGYMVNSAGVWIQ